MNVFDKFEGEENEMDQGGKPMDAHGEKPGEMN